MDGWAARSECCDGGASKRSSRSLAILSRDEHSAAASAWSTTDGAPSASDLGCSRCDLGCSRCDLGCSRCDLGCSSSTAYCSSAAIIPTSDAWKSAAAPTETAAERAIAPRRRSAPSDLAINEIAARLMPRRMVEGEEGGAAPEGAEPPAAARGAPGRAEEARPVVAEWLEGAERAGVECVGAARLAVGVGAARLALGVGAARFGASWRWLEGLVWVARAWRVGWVSMAAAKAVESGARRAVGPSRRAVSTAERLRSWMRLRPSDGRTCA